MKKPVLLVLAEALVCYTLVAGSELDENFEVERGKEISFNWETSIQEVQTYGTTNLDENSQIELEFGLRR